MIGYEWFAVRTLRHVRVVVAVVVGCTVLGSFGAAAVMGLFPELGMGADDVLVSLVRMNIALPVGAVVLAVAVSNADGRRGLALAEIMRAPGRGRAWVAKLVVAVGAAVALALVAGAVAAAAVMVSTGLLSPDHAAAVVLRTVGYAAGWAVVGVGVAGVVGNPLGAVAVPVVTAYVVEPIILTWSAFAPQEVTWLAGLLPFTAGGEFLVGTGATGIYLETDSPLRSAAVFFGVAAVLGAVGFHRYRRADLVPADVV